jgi:hypothetical protein
VEEKEKEEEEGEEQERGEEVIYLWAVQISKYHDCLLLFKVIKNVVHIDVCVLVRFNSQP